MDLLQGYNSDSDNSSDDDSSSSQQQHSSSAGRWMMGTITTSRSSDFEDTVYAEEFIYNLLQQ